MSGMGPGLPTALRTNTKHVSRSICLEQDERFHTEWTDVFRQRMEAGSMGKSVQVQSSSGDDYALCCGRNLKRQCAEGLWVRGWPTEVGRTIMPWCSHCVSGSVTAPKHSSKHHRQTSTLQGFSRNLPTTVSWKQGEIRGRFLLIWKAHKVRDAEETCTDKQPNRGGRGQKYWSKQWKDTGP